MLALINPLQGKNRTHTLVAVPNRYFLAWQLAG